MRTEGILKSFMALAPGLAFLVAAGAASAQVPITTLDTPVAESFDTLARQGNNQTVVPSGWTFEETGTSGNVDGTYSVSTGGGNGAGDTYSFGAQNNTDRAFGSIASETFGSTIGASFVNNSGTTATALSIAYYGEWWRTGDTATDSLVFEYSVNATSLTTGSWVAVADLGFSDQDAPCHATSNCGTPGAKDGNAVGFRVQRSAVITGLSIANGARLWIRWRDVNSVGADHALAIDDFSLTAHAVVPTEPEVSLLKEVAVVGGGTVLPGTVLEYSVLVEVDAASPQGVKDLVLTDTLPAQVSAIVAASHASYLFELDLDTVVLDLTAAVDGDEGEIVGDVVTVRVGDLAVGDLAMLTFRATVDLTNTPATITNVATATFDGASSGFDLTAVSNQASIAMLACTTAQHCADTNPCTDDTCSAQGACLHTANTAPCNDNNACTPSDACVAGACVGSGTLACADQNPCTDDACAPATGCTHVNNTAPCSDGSACTQNDACAAGACVGGAALDCDDDEVCTTDSCDPATGCRHADNTLACDDGSATTHTDTCAGGACAGAAVVCAPGNQCQVPGTPDGTASCPPADKPNTAPCDDGDPATHTDLCDGAGGCVGTPIGECPADTACGTYAPDGQDCVFTPKTGPCDDGQAGTRGDTCQAGSCVGTAFTCTPSQCEAGSIPNGEGCTVAFKAPGATCDDGSVTTRGDACDGAGACEGSAYTCTPGPCEVSSVPDGEGCVTTPRATGSACDDGDACTTGDLCAAGGACAGEALCGAGELCDPAGGCEPTHCLACEGDDECGVDGACVTLGDDARCLVACETDADCGDGQACHDYADGMRCFDAEGPCAEPTIEPDGDPEEVEVVEPGPEAVEPGVEATEPEPEAIEPQPESGPEVGPEPTPESGPEVVEPAPDAGDASGSDTGGSVERDRVEGGGCAGGSPATTGALLSVLAALALLRRRSA